MCTTGLKKTPDELLKSGKAGSLFEFDELYWFLEKKARTKTRENVYLMTLICPEPRMVVGFDVAMDRSAERIQRIIDAAPDAKIYATDGALSYLDVVFPGKHVRNVHNKADTHDVESINADLRHYIPVLARRSRCFCRSLETLQAVIEVFVEAYNAFGTFKAKHRVPVVHKSENPAKHLHQFRELALSHLDYL